MPRACHLCIHKPMPKRRRKRGRPRTGHDPVVTIRLPAAVIGRIGRWATELGTNRSLIVRLLMEHVTGYGSYKAQVVRSLLVTGLQSRRRGRTQADRIAFEVREDLKTLVATYLAARKRPTARRAKRTKALAHQGPRAEMTDAPLALEVARGRRTVATSGRTPPRQA